MPIAPSLKLPGTTRPLAGWLALLLLTGAQALTNPIHMINLPANQVLVDVRFFVYTVKIQKQSFPSVYKPTGGDPVVAYLKSDLANTQNSLFEWHDRFFEQAKTLSKEEFRKADFKFRQVFEHMTMLKDPYDSFRVLPVPKTLYRQRTANSSTIDGLTLRWTYREALEVVVLDLSLQTLRETGDKRDLFLSEVCAAIGEAKFKSNYLCVFELEDEPQAHFPAFELGRPGNYIAVRLGDMGYLGLHTEEADEMPTAAASSPEVQAYLGSIQDRVFEQVRAVLAEYSKQITSAFGDIKEEVWLSDSSKIVGMLNELEYWRKKFEVDLNKLDFKELRATTLPSLRQAFAQLHEGYRENYKKSSTKLETFRAKNRLTQLLAKYPVSIATCALIFLSFAVFFKREQKDLSRVFSKSYNI